MDTHGNLRLCRRNKCSAGQGLLLLSFETVMDMKVCTKKYRCAIEYVSLTFPLFSRKHE